MRELYLLMDPHQLDSSQIDYEVMLRGMDVRKSRRNRATAIVQAIHNETTGFATLDHLYCSPVETERDMEECLELCRALDKQSRGYRIDRPTLDRLWSQTVHLITRVNRVFTVDEKSQKNKFEMLFWAEMIRERIEGQRNPHDVFIPCVEIPIQYQRIPEEPRIEDISDSDAQTQNQIHQLSQRLQNVAPIQPASPTVASAPFAIPVTAASETLNQTMAQPLVPPPQLTPVISAPSSFPSQGVWQNTSTPFFNTNQWRDPNNKNDEFISPELESPEYVIDFMKQMRDENRERQRQILQSLDNFSDFDLTGPDSAKRNTVLNPPQLRLPEEMRTHASKATGAIPKQTQAPMANMNGGRSISGAMTNTVYSSTTTAPIMNYEFPTPPPANTAVDTPTTHTVPTTRSTTQGPVGQYSKAIREEIDRRKRERGGNDQRTVTFRKTEYSDAPHPEHKTVREKQYRSTVHEMIPRPNPTPSPSTKPADEPRKRASTVSEAELKTTIAKVMQETYGTAIKQLQLNNTKNTVRPTQTNEQAAPSEALCPNMPSMQLPLGTNRNVIVINDDSPSPVESRKPFGNVLPQGQRPYGDVICVDSASGSERSSHHDNDRNRRRDRRHPNRNENTEMNQDTSGDGPLIDHIKPIQVGQWKICFSGDTPPINKYDVDIHRFLGQVDAFRRTARLSHRAVLSQILHLLVGSARDWFQLES